MALTLRRVLGTALLLAAAGCPKSVSLPVADPGAALSVNTGSTVRLDGSNSKDPQNRPLVFTWSFVSMPAGSTAQLNDPHSQTPSFNADVPGIYVLQLVVANSFLTSNPVTVTVTVATCGANAPTTGALSASPASPGVGQVVLLSANAHSADNDPGCALNEAITYSWRMISQPASSTATLNNAAAVSPSFTPDVPGDYSFRLVVTSSTGRTSTPTDFTVTASNCGFNRPVIPGLTSNGLLDVGSSVQLQLTAAIADADNTAACGATAAGLGETFSYGWQVVSLPQGSHAGLNSSTSDSPTFVPDVAGTYHFSLVVTSSNGRVSDPKDITLVVTSCGGQFPVVAINAQTPASPVIGDTIQLTATASDPDQTACTPSIPQPLTYAWSISAAPIGSHASLNNATSTNPSFVADQNGAYQVQLAVTDPQGHRTLATPLNFSVANCGAAAPTIGTETYTPAQTVIAGAASTVTVSVPVTAPDNQASTNCGAGLHETLGFNWTLTIRPPGSNAFIAAPTATGVSTNSSGAATASASFVADVPDATYQLELVATASNGRSSAPKFFSVNTNVCGAQAPSFSSALTATSTLAGHPTVFNIDVPVTLASAPIDPDDTSACGATSAGLGQALTVTWSVVSRPAASGAALATPSVGSGAAYSTSFTPDAVGTYQFSAVVTDSTGLSSPQAFVSFTTTTCGTNAPTVQVNGKASDSVTVAPLTTLNASGPAAVATSSDADTSGTCGMTDPATYLWSIVTRPSASKAIITDPTNATLTYTPDAAGDYTLQVVATDSTGLSSAPAFLDIHVTSCGLIPPVVSAVSIAPSSGSTVLGNQLIASITGSTDSNCLSTGISTYDWSLVTRPASSSAVLLNPASGTPAFTPDATGTYQVSVVITDSQGFSSEPFFKSVNVGDCSTASDVSFVPTSVSASAWAASHPYPANSVVKRVTAGGTLVFLSGNSSGTSGASEPSWNSATLGQTFTDNNINWTAIQPNPVNVSWVDPDSSHAIYQTNLNAGAQVTLSANVIDANTVACGSLSVAPDSYQWALVSTPLGSRAQLTTPTGASPGFVPDVPGDYQVSVIVTDALGKSTPTQFWKISTSSCGHNAPTITSLTNSPTALSSGAATVNSFKAQTLTAVIADDDNDATKCPARLAQAVTETWSIATQTAGGSASLSTNSGLTTAFEAFTKGGYGVLFSVASANGLSASSTASFTVNECGANPPSINGATTSAAPLAATWQASTSYPVGTLVLPTKANGYEFTSSGGTSGTTEPVWNPTGATPSDNGITWTATAFNQGSRPRAGQDTVQLTATATDPDFASGAGGCGAGDTIASYNWSAVSLPSGSAVTVAPANITTSSVTPFTTSVLQFNPDVAGTYVFSVSATDATGLTSAAVDLTVQTAVCSPAFSGLQDDHGGSVTMGVVDTVSLTSSVTDTCVNPATLTYAWTLITRPSASKVTLPSGSNASSASTVAFTPDVPGQYQVQLVVSDQGGFSSAAVVQTVQANSCGTSAPQITNRSTLTTPFLVENSVGTEITPPIAGKINIGDVVSLAIPNIVDGNGGAANGSCSTAQVTPFSYSWAVISAPNGSLAQLSSTTAAIPDLKPDVPGTYVVSVSVTDALGNLSAPAFLSIQTSNCGANIPLPYIQDSSGNTLAAAVGIPSAVTGTVSNTLTAVQSNASISLTPKAYDADADTAVCPASFNTPAITYSDKWSITSRTAGANSSITNTVGTIGTTAANTSFLPTNVGTSKVALTVASSNGFTSAPLELPITSTACGSSIPQVTTTTTLQNGTATSRPQVGSTSAFNVTISATSADADTDGTTVCGTALSKTGVNAPVFNWTLVSAPAGADPSHLPAAFSGSPVTFRPTVAGTYVYSVTVNYPVTGLTSQPVQVTIPTGSCGPNLTSISAASTNSNQAGFAVNLSTAPNATGLSSACVAGGGLSYAWSLTSRPAGSAAVIVNPTAQGMPTTAWAQNTAYLLGAQVTNGGFAFRATVGGTSATSGSGPTPGNLSDAGVTWAVVQTASFTPDVTGNYQVQMVLTDSGGFSTVQTTTINITTCAAGPAFVTTGFGSGNPGVINWSATNPSGTTTTSNGQIDRGDRVQLFVPAGPTGNNNIIASTCDTANSATYSFQWTMIGRPANSTATLSSTTAAQPVFFPDVANGVYKFLVTVTDSLGNSASLSSAQIVGTKKDLTTLVGTSDCGTRVPTAPTITPSITTANSFQSVTLTAGMITDPEQSANANFNACDGRFNNTSYSYSWSSSPSANVTFGAATAATTFVASKSGNYTVSLNVAGNTDGVSSTTATTQGITVNQCGSNPPIAAGFSAAQTFLDGVSPNFGAAWTPSTAYVLNQQVSNGGKIYKVTTAGTSDASPATGPSGTTTFNETTVHWAFVATASPANNLPVQVAVTVTDADETSACTTISGSSTGVLPANDGFTIQWTLTPPPSSKAKLTNATTIQPSFTPDVPGDYTLSETSTDVNGDSNSQSFKITTNNCGTLSPIITNPLTAKQFLGSTEIDFNGTTQFMDLGLPIQLGASVANVNDTGTCAHPVATTSYAWSFLAVPPGSAAAMLGATTSSGSFVPDVATTIPTVTTPTFYSVQLVATDSLGHSSTSAQLNITAICGATPPHLNTGGSFWASQTVAVTSGAITITHSSVPSDTTFVTPALNNVSFYQGYPVQLFSSSSDSDDSPPSGCTASTPTVTTSYAWTLVNVPSGSNARLNNSTAANPSFIPDVPGDYDLQLVLTDSSGKSSGPIALGTMSGTGTPLSIPTPSATGCTAACTTSHVIHVEACGGGAPTAQIAVDGPIVFAAGSGYTATEPLFSVGAGPILLDAGASSDPDNSTLNTGVTPATGCGLSRPLSYQWSLTSIPAGASTSELSGTAIVNPTLSPSTPGTYGLALDVSAGGKTSHATLAVQTMAKSFVGSSGTNHALYTAIATDPTSGNPVVAFMDGDTGDIHVQRCTSGCTTSTPTWTALPDVDVLGADPFVTPSLDEDPRPLDVKVGSDGTVFVAYGTGPATPTGGHGSSNCSARLAAFGPTAASWSYVTIFAGFTSLNASGTAGCTNDDRLASSTLTGSTTFTTLTAFVVHFGRWVTLALDPTSSQPRVVVEEQDGTLSCNTGAGTSCTPPSPIPPTARNPIYSVCTWSGSSLACGGAGSGSIGTPPMSGRWPSLKIDGSGFAHAAFYVDATSTGIPSFAANSLVYTTNSSGSFTAVQADVDGVGDVGRFASLDLAKPFTLGNPFSSYAPRIAYLDKGAASGAVKLAAKNIATGFTSTTVDTAIDPSSLGESIALVIDPSSGDPTIAYRAGSSGFLKLASSISLTSGFQFLAPLATGGASISMAETPAGGFRISYQGSSSGSPQLEVQAIGQ